MAAVAAIAQIQVLALGDDVGLSVLIWILNLALGCAGNQISRLGRRVVDRFGLFRSNCRFERVRCRDKNQRNCKSTQDSSQHSETS
jgi:hypothetical protein